MSSFTNIPSAIRAFSTAAAPSPKKSKRRYTPLFSLRLTVEERKRLDELAGNQPLGRIYVIAFSANRLRSAVKSKNLRLTPPCWLWY